MKNSIAEILKDEKKLKNYIQSLEKDIDSTEVTDQQVEKILTNILTNLDDFKDRRSLKATLIESVTGLIKLKSELPLKRVQSKKTLLDMMTRKEELEIKRIQAQATSQIAGSTVDMLTMLYTTLDKLHVHPYIDDESTLTADCVDIIDSTALISEVSESDLLNEIEEDKKIKSGEVNIDDIITDEVIQESNINIIDIQSQLEDLDE